MSAWWESDSNPDELWASFKNARASFSGHTSNMARNYKLYSTAQLPSWMPESVCVQPPSPQSNTAVKMNVVREVCDAIVSQIAREKPFPRFLTSDAQASVRTRADDLGKFVSQAMRLSHVHAEMRRVTLDMVVGGTGICRVGKSATGVTFSRVHPLRFFVDPADSDDGHPTIWYEVSYQPASALIKRYPAHADKIKSATTGPAYGTNGVYIKSDLVEVVEGFSCRNGENYYGIAINGQTLEVEEWGYNEPPYIFLRWSPPTSGWFGESVINDIVTCQIWVNFLLTKLEESVGSVGTWVLLKQGAGVNANQISNRRPDVLSYSNAKPEFHNVSDIPAELVSLLWGWRQKAFEVAGVNESIASGSKPTGVYSGVAISEALDVQSGRFVNRLDAFADSFVELGRWTVRMAKEIAADGEYKVIVGGGMEKVADLRWSEVEIDEDSFAIEIFPASGLPQDPSGRLSRVIELMNGGLIDKTSALKLLSFPDLDAEINLELSTLQATDAMVEEMLDTGLPISPEPYMDLQTYMRRAASHLNVLTAKGEQNASGMAAVRASIEATAQMMRAGMAQQAGMPVDAGTPMPQGPAGQHPMGV